MTLPGDIWSTISWPAGWNVDYLAETGSTNADLLAALADGSAGPRSVLATGHQTAGRGRLDRRWDAPPGANLLVSIAFAPVPVHPADLTHRVGLAAVAAARAIRPDVAISLKWPNDVLLDDVKLAGILAQRASSVDAAVVGIGVNVGWAPDGAAKLDRGHPAELLAAMLRELDALPADIGPHYRAELATIGRSVRVELPGDSVLEGVAVDVDEAGRLVVETPGAAAPTRHVLDVGDIVHLRTA